MRSWGNVKVLSFSAGSMIQSMTGEEDDYDPELEVCIMDLVEKYCQLDGIKEKEPFCSTVEVRASRRRSCLRFEGGRSSECLLT